MAMINEVNKKELEDVVKKFIDNCSVAFDVNTKSEFCSMLTRNIVGSVLPRAELNMVIEDSGMVYGGAGTSRLCLYYKNTLAIKIDKAHPQLLVNIELGIHNDCLLLDGNMCELRNYKSLLKAFPFLDIFLLPYYHYFMCGEHFVSVFPKAKTPFRNNPFNNELYLRKKLGLIMGMFGDNDIHNVGYWKDVWLLDFNTEDNGLLIHNKMKEIEQFLSEFPEEIEETRKMVAKEMGYE